MFKFIFYLLPFVVTFSLTSEEPTFLPIKTAPTAICQQNNEIEKKSLFSIDDKSNFLDEIDSHWIHWVSEINEKGYHIVLEDGSVWETNWWGHHKVKNWNEDDLIVLFWESSSHSAEVKNLTKGNSVSGSYYSHPKSDSQNLQRVQYYEDNYSTIVLNNGCRIHSPYANIFVDWKENELVIPLVMNHKKKISYALLNPIRNTLIWELTVY